MFLGVLNTIFLNISYFLPHLELRNCSILTAVIMNVVVTSNVSIKRADCIIIKHFMNNMANLADDTLMFVCVEVLRPSQPNGVMSSAVSLPNHTFTGQA